MTEEKKYPRRKPARMVTVRSLSADTEGPVRIMAIVIESNPGASLVQDIYDNVDDAAKIIVTVEGTLTVAEKYLLIGEVTEKTGPDGKELRLVASLAYNINNLDTKLYKQTIEMEDDVVRALSK
ncbi:MAG: hypothetical protein ACXADC_11540 [Candidatus Thorarchaeota archaeon]